MLAPLQSFPNPPKDTLVSDGVILRNRRVKGMAAGGTKWSIGVTRESVAE